jgi:hypothetical protein
MKRLNPTFCAGLFLAAISLTFSATGLVHLFAGAGIAIAVMALAFELAKVTTTVYLLQNWRLRFVPVVLSVALLCLMGVSSLGIYGYLGKAYNVGHRSIVESVGAVDVLTRQVGALEADKARLLGMVEAIPVEHSTNRRRVLTEVQPAVDRIDQELRTRWVELGRAQRTQIGAENDVGELGFAANLLGTSQDGLAHGVITALAFLLDPLAVLLILASGAHGTRSSIETPDLPGAVAPCPSPLLSDRARRLSPALQRVLQRATGSSTLATATLRKRRS